MIQRIQSVYLFAAAMLFLFLFTNPIARLQIDEGLFLELLHSKIVAVSGANFDPISVWPLTILISAIIMINLIALSLYRKRGLQMRLCVFNIILMFGLVGLIWFFVKYTLNRMNGIDSVFLWPIVVPFISIVLNYLAYKGIQKDDALVKSYDRIR